jgi:hypothetical protein
MNQFWRLSDAGADNLGLACTNDGLSLGHASLIERRGGCYIVRERDEIDRLLKRAYEGEPPVDRGRPRHPRGDVMARGIWFPQGYEKPVAEE